MTHASPLPSPEIPKAFASHDKIMQVLCATVEDFSCDEQQAIYLYHHLEMSTPTIARILDLTEQHVTSALVLYTERLASKLELFKRVQPHDDDDMLHVRDILLPWTA
ncbi:MAG: hypothetical protein FWC71_01725 [Defluviitaleaceae bacterium]|nr:hypothetical protein [Defluviitaleaceae bacterium]